MVQQEASAAAAATTNGHGHHHDNNLVTTSRSSGGETNNTNTSATATASATTIEDQRAKCSFLYREDLAPGLTFEMTLRGILTSTQSAFQKVDVIETFYGKMLVTDGKTQSAEFDEFVYHESLVHPPMLKFAAAHRERSNSGTNDEMVAGPRSVFIGGGGELATAREVLRYHKSLERVVMVDLDEKVIEVSKQYLPEWGGDAVLNDPRFTLVVGDAYEYLMNCQETFDVIIMDISDPIEAGPGVMLYTKELYQHAMMLLNPHGVFVTQSGMAESVPAGPHLLEDDPSCFAPIHNTLAAAFDRCVIPYSANIPSFGSDWGFVMAFKPADTTMASKELVDGWVVPTRGRIDELIEDQIKGGADSLRHYDGTTHLSMMALTKPLRKYIAEDDRIMTRDNPIFMY